MIDECKVELISLSYLDEYVCIFVEVLITVGVGADIIVHPTQC